MSNSITEPTTWAREAGERAFALGRQRKASQAYIVNALTALFPDQDIDIRGAWFEGYDRARVRVAAAPIE